MRRKISDSPERSPRHRNCTALRLYCIDMVCYSAATGAARRNRTAAKGLALSPIGANMACATIGRGDS